MSEHGWSTYAGQLEERVITLNQPTYSKTSGRMTFQRIYEDVSPNTSRYGYYQSRTTIGFEMVTRHNRATHWLVRCYTDGFAMYRKSVLGWLINNYTCTSKIDSVMDKYFYADTVIPDEESDIAHSIYNPTIRVLRRKPLCTVARSIALRETASLGDYLVRKYNFRDKEVTA